MDKKQCKSCNNYILASEVKSLAHTRFCSTCQQLKSRKSSKSYRTRYPDKCKQMKENWQKMNQQKRQENVSLYYTKNKEKIRKYKKQWYLENAAQVKQRVAENHRQRMETDADYRGKHLLRGVIRGAFSRGGFTKNSSAFQMLGCSYQEFMELHGLHPNLGIPKDHHFDHICPCSQAQNQEELIKLQHYSNLAIVPASENLEKSNKKTVAAVQKCKELLGREWIDGRV